MKFVVNPRCDRSSDCTLIRYISYYRQKCIEFFNFELKERWNPKCPKISWFLLRSIAVQHSNIAVYISIGICIVYLFTSCGRHTLEWFLSSEHSIGIDKQIFRISSNWYCSVVSEMRLLDTHFLFALVNSSNSTAESIAASACTVCQA